MKVNVRETVGAVIAEILAQNGLGLRPLQDPDSIARTLGFSSLDLAQLIATLEMELGVDPFAHGASLSEIDTVGKLCALYETYLAGQAA